MAAPRAYPILSDAQKRLFWKKVDRGSASSCWLWTASMKGRGYGAVRVNKQALSAHRVAWELIHGPVPPRKMVYQDFCNDPACCNPSHMKVGSKSDAMLAASRHGTRFGRVSVTKTQKPRKQYAKPYPTLTEKQFRAFWAKVDKRGPDECWEWTAAGKGNYGAFSAGGRQLRATRVSYMLAYSELPLDLDVCHSCDNPGCVNPAHLFLGTRKKNLQDCTEKGRQNAARGVAAGKAKLVPEQVYEIRRRYDAGEPSLQISKDFGVSAQSVGAIGLRKSWEHLPEEVVEGYRRS